MSYLSFGNKKLPSKTAIFNITSSRDCPAKKLGMCGHASKCYALKAERLYPATLPFRKKQTDVFDLLSGEQLAKLFLLDIRGRKHPVENLRFSESGDFRSQADVDKLTECANILVHNGLKVYGYTARKDLDFSYLRRVATVNGNNFMATNLIRVVDKFDGKSDIECPANCNTCDACITASNSVIEILQH